VTTTEIPGTESTGAVVVNAEDLLLVSEAFGLGEVRDITFLAAGIMNRNWRVGTAAGTYALKLLRDVPAAVAGRNAVVLDGLADRGLPVCAPLRTASGEAVLHAEAGDYLVSPWAVGSHQPGTGLSLAEAGSLGALVAEIHAALAQQAMLGPAGTRPRARVTDPDTAVGKADRLLRLLTARREVTAFDVTARTLLEERKVLIGGHYSSAPAGGDVPGPFGWTHGDLQFRNILRDGGVVSAVLDWDRIAVRPLGEEVARTAQVQFGELGYFDLERVAAFAAGYRSVRPLARADLADAVERLWWKRMSDYWVFEFHYDRDDHGPDALMEPGEALLAWWTGHRQEVQDAFAAGA
jgi:homoserine kinase type II